MNTSKEHSTQAAPKAGSQPAVSAPTLGRQLDNAGRVDRLALQRTMGNQAVARLAQARLRRDDVPRGPASPCHCGGRCPHCRAKAPLIQTKLTINEPGDRFEQEADRVADHVLRMPDPAISNAAPAPRGASIQRKCAQCDEEEQLHRLPRANGLALPPISALTGSHASLLQARASGGAEATVAPHLEDAIHRARGGGMPLPPATRGFLEPRFGRDLTGIRIHTDQSSGDVARRLQARAFTVGSDIFFAPGEFAPGTSAGLHTLSHELTHSIQQGAVPDAATAPATQPAVRGGSGGVVQREVEEGQISEAKDVLAKIKQTEDSIEGTDKLAGMRRLTALSLAFNPGAPGKGGPTDAFVYTCNCGWIDLGHFFITGAVSYAAALRKAGVKQLELRERLPESVPDWLVEGAETFPDRLFDLLLAKGKSWVLDPILETVGTGGHGKAIQSEMRRLLASKEPRDIALAYGYAMEVFQTAVKLAADPMESPPDVLTGEQRSAFTMEDLASDCYGAVLAQELADATKPVTIHSLVKEFFDDCHAVYPTTSARNTTGPRKGASEKTRCEMMAETTPGSCTWDDASQTAYWGADHGIPCQYTSAKPFLLKAAKPLCPDASPHICKAAGTNTGDPDAAKCTPHKADQVNVRGIRVRVGTIRLTGSGIPLPEDIHVDNFFMSPVKGVPTFAADLSLKRGTLSVALPDDGLSGFGVDKDGRFWAFGSVDTEVGDVKVLLGGKFPSLADVQKILVGRKDVGARAEAEIGGLRAKAAVSVRYDFKAGLLRVGKGLRTDVVKELEALVKEGALNSLVDEVVNSRLSPREFMERTRALLTAKHPKLAAEPAWKAAMEELVTRFVADAIIHSEVDVAGSGTVGGVPAFGASFTKRKLSILGTMAPSLSFQQYGLLFPSFPALGLPFPDYLQGEVSSQQFPAALGYSRRFFAGDPRAGGPGLGIGGTVGIGVPQLEPFLEVQGGVRTEGGTLLTLRGYLTPGSLAGRAAERPSDPFAPPIGLVPGRFRLGEGLVRAELGLQTKGALQFRLGLNYDPYGLGRAEPPPVLGGQPEEKLKVELSVGKQF